MLALLLVVVIFLSEKRRYSIRKKRIREGTGRKVYWGESLLYIITYILLFWLWNVQSSWQGYLKAGDVVLLRGLLVTILPIWLITNLIIERRKQRPETEIERKARLYDERISQEKNNNQGAT